MGSRAPEEMRSEMMQGSGERTEACQGLGMEERQQQKFMGWQVATRGKLQGVEVWGLKIRDNVIMSRCRNLIMRECSGARSLDYENQELG
jgi:hypothetical protein